MARYVNRRGIVLSMLQAEPLVTKVHAWETSVAQGVSGKEQRVCYLNAAIRSFRARLMAYDLTSDVREQLHLMPMAPVMVPDWSDAVELALPAAAGTSVFTLMNDHIAYRDFIVGDYMLLISRDGQLTDYGVIQSVAGTTVTLNRVSNNAFGYGDFAAPALVCQLSPSTYTEQVAGKYIELMADVTERRQQYRDPIISLSVYSLSFSMTQGGPNPAAQTFNISNIGVSGSVMQTVLTSVGDPVSVSPETAEVTEGEAAVVTTVSIDGLSLPVGTYSYGVKVDTANPFEWATVNIILGVT